MNSVSSVSSAFDTIHDAELSAQKMLEGVKKKAKDIKQSAVKKAEMIISQSKKESDTSFSTKMDILEKEILSQESEFMAGVDSRVKKLEEGRSSLVEKGVDFLKKSVFASV